MSGTRTAEARSSLAHIVTHDIDAPPSKTSGAFVVDIYECLPFSIDDSHAIADFIDTEVVISSAAICVRDRTGRDEIPGATVRGDTAD